MLYVVEERKQDRGGQKNENIIQKKPYWREKQNREKRKKKSNKTEEHIHRDIPVECKWPESTRLQDV